jgi:hypothetical protein
MPPAMHNFMVGVLVYAYILALGWVLIQLFRLLFGAVALPLQFLFDWDEGRRRHRRRRLRERGVYLGPIGAAACTETAADRARRLDEYYADRRASRLGRRA